MAQSMRQDESLDGLDRSWLLAITPAMLLLAPMIAPFISLRHKFFYHLEGSATAVLLAVLLNLLAAWLVLWVLLSLGRRHRWLRIAWWSLFLATLPWVLVHDYAVMMDRGLPAVLASGLILFCPLALLAEILLWRRVVLRSGRAFQVLRFVTALFGLGCLVTVGQLGFYAVATRGLNRPRPLHVWPATVAANPPDKAGVPARVVWIIFDELGDDPLFARRPAGLAMPAFDRLASQSTVFTDAIAPGSYTEQVIPALLMGEPAQRVSFTTDGQFQYQNTAADRWQGMNPGNTVFGDALRAGETTAVVGWHNPYCRILAPVLDHCFWSSHVDSMTPDFDGTATFEANLLGPAHGVLETLLHRDGKAAEEHRADLHIQDLETLLAEADRVIREDRVGFLLVHLPVPHPPGLYDRRRGAITDVGHTSYVDNLAMADRVLAHLRNELEASGAWQNATVLVMGDHAWRTKLLWEGQRSWTAEDQQASHNGAFDPRPAYLIKLPGQQAHAEISASFATLRTRSLLDAVMAGRLHRPEELEQWVQGRGAASALKTAAAEIPGRR